MNFKEFVNSYLMEYYHYLEFNLSNAIYQELGHIPSPGEISRYGVVAVNNKDDPTFKWDGKIIGSAMSFNEWAASMSL